MQWNAQKNIQFNYEKNVFVIRIQQTPCLISWASNMLKVSFHLLASFPLSLFNIPAFSATSFHSVSESLNHFHGPHEFIVLVENWPICHSRQSWPSLFIPGGSSFPGWFVRCAAWRIRLFCWSCFNDHSWLFKKTCYALLINALHNFKHKCLLFKSYMKKRQTHSHYFYEKKEKVCKLRIVTGQKCKTDEQKGYRIIHNGGELAVKIEVAGIQTDQEHT